MTIRYFSIVVSSIFFSFLVPYFALAAPEMKQMEVNGTTLSYVEEGDGIPVVFVHGAISDLRAWDAYRSNIALKRRFIAYTQRYFGTAEWQDKAEHFSRETHSEDLIEFVKGLNAEPVHLVTWSYGGGIGIYAVLKRPDLFRSIVHYEPSANALIDGLPGSVAARKEMFKTFGPAMKAVKAEQLDDAALRFIEAVFRLPEGAAASEPEPWPTYWRENGRTIPAFLAAPAGAPISCEELGAINIPTLVVQGEKTHPRFSMMAENLARCQGNALLVTIPEVTHDGPYRRTDEFLALIENFLALID